MTECAHCARDAAPDWNLCPQHIEEAMNQVCNHKSRREIAPPETQVKDGRLLKKRLWWCKDCGDKWTTSRKIGDVESVQIKVNLK